MEEKRKRKKIFVVNKGSHDLSAAKKYGRLIIMTRGRLHRLAVNQMYRVFNEHLKTSTPKDYILVTSLTVSNMIAAGIFVQKHGRLNLLLFNGVRYIERKLRI